MNRCEILEYVYFQLKEKLTIRSGDEFSIDGSIDNFDLFAKVFIFSKRKSTEKVIRPLDSRTKHICSNPGLVVCTKPSSQPLHNP